MLPFEWGPKIKGETLMKRGDFLGLAPHGDLPATGPELIMPWNSSLPSQPVLTTLDFRRKMGVTFKLPLLKYSITRMLMPFGSIL